MPFIWIITPFRVIKSRILLALTPCCEQIASPKMNNNKKSLEEKEQTQRCTHVLKSKTGTGRERQWEIEIFTVLVDLYTGFTSVYLKKKIKEDRKSVV